MRILQVSELLHPKHGGIAEGVYQQGIEFAKLGHTCEALSADPEPVTRLVESGVAHHAFAPTFAPWKWSPQLVKWLKENVGRFDCVALNGLWMAPMHAAARAAAKAGVPYVVMPHGMMDPYFRRSGKQKFIKDAYWKLSEAGTFAKAHSVFFTAADEESKARSCYPLTGVKGVQVGYGIRDPQRPSSPPPPREGIKLLFMSRIHPKKGLDLVISAMAQLPACVTLDVWGTGDEGYINELKSLSQPLGQRVQWKGFVQGEEKWQAIQDADAMILTSHQENFGVIVAEAMSVRRPVLISKEINIWREVEGDGAGLASENSAEGAKEMIERFLSMSSEERETMGARGRESFLKRFTIEQSAAKFLAGLQEAARK